MLFRASCRFLAPSNSCSICSVSWSCICCSSSRIRFKSWNQPCTVLIRSFSNKNTKNILRLQFYLLTQNLMLRYNF